MIKTYIWILVILAGFIAALWWFTKDGTTMPPQMAQYQNAAAGYELSYPSDLQIKEYTPQIVTIGHIDGEMVQSVADVRTMTIAGESGVSFDDAVVRELTNLCAADGPDQSFSCTGVESSAPFTTDEGVAGTEIYLHSELKTVSSGAIVSGTMGPFIVIPMQSGATVSGVIVVHAPLNQIAGEADTATILSIAKSIRLVGASESRYMDIESFVRNSISELSPIEAQLGGTFYVTAIQTNNGAGTVSYEDGHSAYTADFTYSVAQDGRPSIESFTVRE